MGVRGRLVQVRSSRVGAGLTIGRDYVSSMTPSAASPPDHHLTSRVARVPTSRSLWPCEVDTELVRPIAALARPMKRRGQQTRCASVPFMPIAYGEVLAGSRPTGPTAVPSDVVGGRSAVLRAPVVPPAHTHTGLCVPSKPDHTMGRVWRPSIKEHVAPYAMRHAGLVFHRPLTNDESTGRPPFSPTGAASYGAWGGRVLVRARYTPPLRCAQAVSSSRPS
jgi:hypothetical protein